MRKKSGLIWIAGGLMALGVSACGGGSSGGATVLSANPSDPDSVANTIGAKVGGLDAVLTAGEPPAATNNALAPQASGSIDPIKLAPGEIATFDVNFSGDSVLSRMFVKVVGSSSFFAADLTAGRKIVTKAGTQSIELQLPADISGGSFCAGVSAQTTTADVSNTFVRCIEVDAPVVPITSTPTTTAQKIGAARSLTAKLRQIARNAEDIASAVDAGTVFRDYEDILAAFDPEMGGVSFEMSPMAAAITALGEAANEGELFLQSAERAPSDSTTIDGLTLSIIEGSGNANTTVAVAGTTSEGVQVDINANFPNIETNSAQQVNATFVGTITVPGRQVSTGAMEPDLEISLSDVMASITRLSAEASSDPTFAEIDRMSFNGTTEVRIVSNDGSGEVISFTAVLGGGGVLCTSSLCASGQSDSAVFNPTLIDVAITAVTDQGQRLSPEIRVTQSEASARRFAPDVPASASNFVEGAGRVSGTVNLPGLGFVEAIFDVETVGYLDSADTYLFNASVSLTLDEDVLTVSTSNSASSGEVEEVAVNGNGVTLLLSPPADGSPLDGQIFFGDEKIGEVDAGSGDSPIIRYVDGTFESLF